MIEPEKPLKMKEQIRLDKELAFKLQAEEEEEARLAREKAEKQEELTDEEKARLFVELLEKRKKHFAALRAQEKRNKPPTKAQKKSTMSTYLKHMDTELVKDSSKKAKAEMAQESSSKRVGEELVQEVAKKHKMEDDKKKEDLKQCFEIVQDDEVEIDDIPLVTKPAPIFDRKDLENLWKLVKAKHGITRPEEGYERVLWGDLKTIFQHHVEDLIWRNLQGKKVLLWRLYDSCGIHFVRFEDMHIYMLVEKRYPLTPATIINMLNKKLQADCWNEMSLYKLSKIYSIGINNCRGEGHYASNFIVKLRKRDAAYLQQQLQIAQKDEAEIQLNFEEFDFMAVADGLAEVHYSKNCYDNDIFNMFTQEERYTELLEPIPEPHQVQQNDSNVISAVSSMEQSGETVEQHPANVEETRVFYD
ncbi:hypothetical protein Tco_0351328 [Tanacetum coccineum]